MYRVLYIKLILRTNQFIFFFDKNKSLGPGKKLKNKLRTKSSILPLERRYKVSRLAIYKVITREPQSRA